MRRGGTAFVVDNDGTRAARSGAGSGAATRRSTPARWSGSGPAHGWQRTLARHRWRFATRADLEAVVRIELDPATAAAESLAEHEGTEVDYAVNLWWRRY